MEFGQHFIVTAAALTLGCSLLTSQTPGKSDFFVYVGTFTTGSQSKGIYAYRLDTATGKLSPVGLVAETPSPAFLAIHPNGKLLYAANEVNEFAGQKAGSITAFHIDAKTAKLIAINTVSSRGPGPCHVNVDRSGKCVLVANYSGGSFAAMPIRADGGLSEATFFDQHTGTGANPKRQEKAHAHSVNLSPDNRFAIVADLGVDKLYVYKLDAAKAMLTPNEPAFAAMAPGSGPRHFMFHPDGKHAYVINELQSTITALGYDAAKGTFQQLQTITTLPKDFTGNNSTAEVQVHPSGKFVYGSNRGHDSIAVYSIDPTKRTLTWIENVSTQGKNPRNFGIDPTGSFLLAANQNSNNIVVYRIDAKTGRLTPTGQMVDVPAPVCVKFLEAARN
jgi:6-phosphogluconolactonase